MGTYQSKYTGAEIDALLDTVKNGGGTGGSGYSETELLSETVTYAQSTTSNTSAINQDLVLLDDVTNYDEIVINYCSGATNSSQRYTNTEHRILVSNIVYNNSDSAINARELIILQLTMQVMRFMTIWFRTPNTIRISNTRSEGTVPAGNFFEVFSIKGIKYEGGSSGGSSEIAYSTEETKIGTWIDGKPIYRKVITGNKISSASGNTGKYLEIKLTELNINIFTNIQIFQVDNNIIGPIPSGSVGGNIVTAYWFDKSTGGLCVDNSNSNAVGREVVCIIEYTKTTD